MSLLSTIPERTANQRTWVAAIRIADWRVEKHWPFLILLLVLTILNCVYLIFCPYDLAPDEAHYWHWSQHLDWSYYSKGPLVAWVIRLSCEIFGNTVFAIRLPAVMFHAITLGGVYLFGLQNLWDRRLTWALLAGLMTLPILSASAILMTIDAPLLACWIWACVLLFHAEFGQRFRQASFWCAGLIVAVGLLAKLTILFVPFGYLAYRRGHLWQWRWRFGSWLLVCVSGLIPIVLWNSKHDWVSWEHLYQHTGGAESKISLLHFFTFLSGQVGVLGAIWWLIWLRAIWQEQPWQKATSANSRFCWWLSVPIVAVCFLVSFRTPGQPNWPIPGYLAALPLVMLETLRLWPRRAWRISMIVCLCLGALTTIGLRFPSLWRPALNVVAPAPSVAQPEPIRQFDPTARLSGWQTLAKAVDHIRSTEQSSGRTEPILVGMTWIIPGELCFYCSGHPTVYSAGTALADRHSQYDLWRPNPVDDAQEFVGQTFLYIGEGMPEEAFGSIEFVERVVHQEGGVPLASWKLWLCRDFRGFPPRKSRKPLHY